ncbi:helix-turn-helix domain-containing protein [Nocardia callitridis]|uniref:Helix-turn-helix transcriptional regulator n=1 Tax=Nocardia callitridis TaxID=648753 RepID=A0ABP9L6G0_9NOCA
MGDDGYREWSSRYGGATVWTKTVAPGAIGSPVLPDGCIDLIWADGTLLVAGPDTKAHHPSASGRDYVGFRFFPGTAPTLLGVPAHELRDRRVDLADLWDTATTRRLTARVDDALDRAGALEAVVLERASGVGPVDPLVRGVVGALDSGRSVTEVAEMLSVDARTLHRKSLAAFGYGPKTLARILRVRRAIAAARGGLSFADTAATTGFADQAHLARDVREFAGTTLRQLLSRP